LIKSAKVGAAGEKRGGLATPPQVSWHRGWLPLATLPAAAVWLFPPTWPQWSLMWALALAIYFGCKWLTWRRTIVDGVAFTRSIGYLVAWPGLDAYAFLDPTPTPWPARPTWQEWAFAWSKLALGIVIFFGVARLTRADSPYFTGWIGMAGLALGLHFGLFHLLSCAWRRSGVNAAPLMNWPILSVSLSEFWGRRWNRAFRDLAHRFLFRPLTPLIGGAGALVAGFIFSGLVHDAVISIPAKGGCGGPTLFFVIQAAGLLAERSRPGRRLGLGSGWRGWLFASLLLIGPAPLLFHPPFVMRIIVPFMHAVGAI
jgi:hypothetical protein